MNRKRFLWLFAAMTVCMITFSACGGDDDDDDNNPDDIEMTGTGGNGGTDSGKTTQVSDYKIDDFLYKWYIDAIPTFEFMTSLLYEAQGNMEQVEKLRTSGIEFTSGKNGYFWYKSGNRIETESFTWSLGEGKTMYIKQGSTTHTYEVSLYIETHSVVLYDVEYASISFKENGVLKTDMRYSREISKHRN